MPFNIEKLEKKALRCPQRVVSNYFVGGAGPAASRAKYLWPTSKRLRRFKVGVATSTSSNSCKTATIQ
jgi:hypothetical protein